MTEALEADLAEARVVTHLYLNNDRNSSVSTKGLVLFNSLLIQKFKAAFLFVLRVKICGLLYFEPIQFAHLERVGVLDINDHVLFPERKYFSGAVGF